MKTFLLMLAVLIYSTVNYAQEKKEVTIKAGTIVPLEAINNVRASKVHEGQTIDFKVSRDVVIDRIVTIPAGTIAKGTVYEAKRSAWFGTMRINDQYRLEFREIPSQGDQSIIEICSIVDITNHYK